MSLAVACDLRVGCFYGAVKRLTDLVGPAQAKRLLYTGERFSAEEMLRIGLIDELLLAPDQLAPRVRALTATLAANAPLTIAAAKYAVDRCLGGAERRGRSAARPRYAASA